MTRPPTACEARFREAAPRGLYETLWRYLDTLYPAEYKKAVDNYRYDAGLTLLPHQRRAQIETDLPELAHRLGLASSVEYFPNTTDSFVLIHLSEDVKLIVCYLRNKKAAVRYALARSNLAKESNQPYLIPPEEGRLVLTRQTLFAVLTHSPAPHDLGRFEGGTFTFPSPDEGATLGQLNLQREMERVQAEDVAAASAVERKVEIKIKKGG